MAAGGKAGSSSSSSKRGSTPLIRQEFVQHIIESEDQPVAGPSDLSSDQLSRAYGLSRQQQLVKQCTCRWSSDTREGDGDDGVLVLGSSDDDDDGPPSSPKKQSNKGKGKAKADTKVCSADNCTNNPKCLNWLGQDKWETSNPATALKSYLKVAGLGPKPPSRRNDDTPCGLRNLGATCYANSFLQVWFRDVTFRAGVYACLPPQKSNVEKSPLFQLQVLFAFLQKSHQTVYDPEPLVSSLKLDTSEQQDATEFSKLFMTMLDDQFKKQGRKSANEGGNPAVARLVQDQFEGSIVYGTKCTECGHRSERQETYHELEITLKRDCRLETQLLATFQDEELSGDNQYFCESCQRKQDAERFTRLESVPPVLHFSILRFVFNHKDFSRSKSQNAISYPLKLDMAQFLPRDARTGQKRDDMLYELKGVLMHKGKSAHHGHYVAQVHEESRGKWFLFDDECVTPIDDLNGPDLYDEEGERVEAATTKKKVKAGGKASSSRDKNGEFLPKSKDAYMLVYTRRPPENQPRAAEPDPPPLALSRVEELDKKHEDLLKAFQEKRDQLKIEFGQAREAKRAVYRSWDVPGDAVEGYLVDKHELRRWVEDGIVMPPKTSNKSGRSKGKEKEVVLDADDDGGKTQANGVASASPTREASTNASAASGSALNSPAPAQDKSPISEDVDMADLVDKDDALEATSAPRPHERDGDVKQEEDTTTTPPDVGDIGLATARTSTIKRLDNGLVTCEHGRADPEEAARMKRVSKEAVMKLREMGVDVVPSLSVPDDFCRECVWAMAARTRYAHDHPQRVSDFKNLNQRQPRRGSLHGKSSASDEDENDVWISKAWLQDWQKSVGPKTHNKKTGSDPAPDDAPYEHDVICEHGMLQPDKKLRIEIKESAATVLTALFPSWQPVVVDALDDCQKCVRKQAQNAESAHELVEIAKREKSICKSFLEVGQMKLHGTGFILDDNTSYIIPRDFINAWVRWAKTPAKYERPGPVDCSQFLCRHGRVLVDLAREAERPDRVGIAFEKEWKLLEKSYDAKPKIRIWQDDETNSYLTLPQTCQECLEEKRKDFSNAMLAVKTLGPADFDEKGERKIDASALESPEKPSAAGLVKPTPSRATGGRKSARISKQPMMQSRKALQYIEMHKDDTVRDLKVRIDENLGIPTICQRLFYKFTELDNERTVEDVGLFDTAIIELFEVKEADMDKLDDTIDDATAGKSKRSRDEGFGGTGLFGWDAAESQEDMLSGLTDAELIANGLDPAAKRAKKDIRAEKKDDGGSSDVLTREAAAAAAAATTDAKMEKVACGACTAHNDPSDFVCDVCGAEL